MGCHGILSLFINQKDYTSHDIVAGSSDALTRQKKAGHTGTLDPEVEGVLPVCLGQATRIAEYMQALPKQISRNPYIGEWPPIRKIIRAGHCRAERVESGGSGTSGRGFLGRFSERSQVPPMYSAVKVNGKRFV